MTQPVVYGHQQLFAHMMVFVIILNNANYKQDKLRLIENNFSLLNFSWPFLVQRKDEFFGRPSSKFKHSYY